MNVFDFFVAVAGITFFFSLTLYAWGFFND